jgi:hypothetical protein
MEDPDFKNIQRRLADKMPAKQTVKEKLAIKNVIHNPVPHLSTLKKTSMKGWLRGQLQDSSKYLGESTDIAKNSHTRLLSPKI